MKPLPSRMESFWCGVIAGVIATLAFSTPAKAACESQHVGVFFNTAVVAAIVEYRF